MKEGEQELLPQRDFGIDAQEVIDQLESWGVAKDTIIDLLKTFKEYSSHYTNIEGKAKHIAESRKLIYKDLITIRNVHNSTELGFGECGDLAFDFNFRLAFLGLADELRTSGVDIGIVYGRESNFFNETYSIHVFLEIRKESNRESIICDPALQIMRLSNDSGYRILGRVSNKSQRRSHDESTRIVKRNSDGGLENNQIPEDDDFKSLRTQISKGVFLGLTPDRENYVAFRYEKDKKGNIYPVTLIKTIKGELGLYKLGTNDELINIEKTPWFLLQDNNKQHILNILRSLQDPEFEKINFSKDESGRTTMFDQSGMILDEKRTAKVE